MAQNADIKGITKDSGIGRVIFALCLLLCLMSPIYAEPRPVPSTVVQYLPDGTLPGQGDTATDGPLTPDEQAAWDRYARQVHRHEDNMRFWRKVGPYGNLFDLGTTEWGLAHGAVEGNVALRALGPWGILAAKGAEFFYARQHAKDERNPVGTGIVQWLPGVVNVRALSTRY